MSSQRSNHLEAAQLEIDALHAEIERLNRDLPAWFVALCSEEMQKAIKQGPKAFCSYVVRHPREYRVNGPRAAGISVAEDENLERNARAALYRFRHDHNPQAVWDVLTCLIEARWGSAK